MDINFNSEKVVKDYLISPRWEGIKRQYSDKDVQRLRPAIKITNSISEHCSNKLWDLLKRKETWISGLGAATAQQALQMFNLDYEIIYVSGWQIAAESNVGNNTYPDLSLYPSNSTPNFVTKINNTLIRKITETKGTDLPPIIADGESGFGGIYNVYDLTSQFIKAGTAGIHFEDQLASEKKCGHVGGKVVIPTHEYIKKLNASRLSTDVAGSPVLIIARTDALNAKLITSDFDDRDKEFISKERTSDGYFLIKNNEGLAISKALAYSEYADVIWCETNTPDLGFAKEFADEIKNHFPKKILAYNCSPSFNWKKHLSDDEIASFQQEIAKMGYKFQFITLAGFHTQNIAIFELAEKYRKEGMAAYSRIQQQEFAREKDGYTSVKHQREVGTSYFDAVSNTISSGQSSTTAMAGSTESEQF